MALGDIERKNSRGGTRQNEVMETEVISLEKLYLAQIVVQCVRKSLDSEQDAYLQFNSLI